MASSNTFYLDVTFVFCRGNEVFLGANQIRLLKQVILDGSIHAAAKNLKISYQHAWHLLDKVNQLAPLPVLIRQKGGKDGGGCIVSNYGLKLIRMYEAKEAVVRAFLIDNDTDFDTCFF